MSLSYVTVPDIENLTGTKLSTTVLTAIGEQAEREAVSYLTAKGVTSYSGNAVKSAVLKLSHAGVLLRYHAEATLTKSDGATGTTYQDYTAGDPSSLIASLRKEAMSLLDQYAESQTVSGTYSTFIRKVNGRC